MATTMTNVTNTRSEHPAEMPAEANEVCASAAAACMTLRNVQRLP